MPTIEQARAWYPSYDAVHGFDHILRVLALAERLAKEEGADLDIVRAAVLLHDASGGGANEPGRSEHQYYSAEFANEVLEQEGWPLERIAAVQHAIRAHRFRGEEQPASLEAQIVFDADKLDVLGAWGVARTIAYAVEKEQPLFAEPSARFRESGEVEEGEPHSAYHEFIFKLRKVKEKLNTASARAIAEERHAFLNDFFEALAREARGQD